MALLLDIEGTTTPISFVHDELFPYAERHLDSYLDAKWSSPEVQQCYRLAADEDASLRDRPEALRQAEFASAMRAAMGANKKLTSLKRLQGLIWRNAYESGEVKGVVFEDVPVALERIARKFKIAIYSSGSIDAQQLLFRHTTYGDLTQYISAYFDTTTGPKQSSESYRKIASDLKLEPKDVLFLTDIPKEAQAATEAGCRAALVERSGNSALTDEDRIGHLQIHTLDNLDTLLSV